ncbi:MAG: two pore domain potassium channel family protein [Polyangiaceae bacterium]|nr:two pore domain potassium channel family protein [Polyangiaceae bacterium]
MANVLSQRAGASAEPAPRDDAGLTLLAAIAGIALDGGDERDGYGALKERLRTLATRDPVDSLLATVLGGGLLFYLAERDTNPRCGTYWDAVLYVATSLSVGYDDVFPRTPVGNLFAAAVQTFGPALANAAFAPPAAEAQAERAAAETARTAAEGANAELLAVNKAILARLEEIAAALAARP